MDLRVKIWTVLALLGLGSPSAADVLRVRAPRIVEGTAWHTLVFDDAERAAPALAIDPGGTFWDLRPKGTPSAHVAWTAMHPSRAGLGQAAEAHDADLALCADEVASGRRIGCSLFHGATIGPDGPAVVASFLAGTGRRAASSLIPTETIEVGDRYEQTWLDGDGATRVQGRAIAEGLALAPSGPVEVVLVRESLAGARSGLRWRFLATTGDQVAVLEGDPPPAGAPFVPRRIEVRLSPLADDGIEVPYAKLSAALVPGRTGFLQYSQENQAALSTLDPGWAGVPEMISIDASGVTYQPDPSDGSTAETLPEVWDFTGLQPANLAFRTFNTTRDDLAGNTCGEVCSTRDVGPNPPDGTWQAYLKIDNYQPDGTFLTRDIFDLNDNDTGADPSIDVPYVAQNELNVDNGRTQICFEQSAGGPDRLLRFFQFTGPDPASAVLGVGDTWESGNWTECDNANGLKLTATQLCPDACWPECGAVNPRARGLLGNGVGLRATIVEDGWVHVGPGNYVPALLMRQDTDVEAGVDFFGVCNISPTRLRAFDYFWLHEDYGLLALVSSPSDETITAEDWSAVGNVTDGADFTWGPFPPYQAEASACLSATRIDWALPQDGSNLTGEPGVADYGYVVSWGSLADPEDLADWDTNPNHTPLPGEAGYLVAPAGSEPDSYVVTSWPAAAIHATVVTALRYTDPDVADQTTYASPAFYKVAADPARLDAGSFVVGDAVAPFVDKAGADLALAWPAVAGADGYLLQVFDLDTGLPIGCPAGLDCNPASAGATHAGAAASAANLGYRVFAVDPCGEASAD